MPIISTIRGDRPLERLIKRVDETAIERPDGYRAVVVATEYCERECEGPAHESGVADGNGCFCHRNIRRDVDVRVIHLPGFEAVAEALSNAPKG